MAKEKFHRDEWFPLINEVEEKKLHTFLEQWIKYTRIKLNHEGFKVLSEDWVVIPEMEYEQKQKNGKTIKKLIPGSAKLGVRLIFQKKEEKKKK